MKNDDTIKAAKWSGRISIIFTIVAFMFYLFMRRDLTTIPESLLLVLNSRLVDFYLFKVPLFLFPIPMIYFYFRQWRSFSSYSDYTDYYITGRMLKDFSWKALLTIVSLVGIVELYIFVAS